MEEAIIEEIKKLISSAQKIVITAHTQPDPDAICACIGMHMWVQSNYPGKEVKSYIEEDFATINFEYIPNLELINKTDNMSKVVDDETTLIILDCPGVYRCTKFEENLQTQNIIIVDHHPELDTPGIKKYTNTKTTSSCEIISRLFCTDEELKNDQVLCEVLLLGILADAGGISYVGTRNSGGLLEIKRLIDLGKVEQLENLQLKASAMLPGQLDPFKAYTKNATLKTLEGVPPFVYTFLTKEEFSKLDPSHIKPARAKFHFTLTRKIKGYPWGIIVTPNPEKESFSVSFRSLVGSIDVKSLATTLGDGGGHVMAAATDFVPKNGYHQTDTVEALEEIFKIIGNSEIKYQDL